MAAHRLWSRAGPQPIMAQAGRQGASVAVEPDRLTGTRAQVWCRAGRQEEMEPGLSEVVAGWTAISQRWGGLGGYNIYLKYKILLF